MRDKILYIIYNMKSLAEDHSLSFEVANRFGIADRLILVFHEVTMSAFDLLIFILVFLIVVILLFWLVFLLNDLIDHCSHLLGRLAL